MADAETLFERLLALRNDLGLLAEEYDPQLERQLGNFPQAFSHVALINTAFNLLGPRSRRSSVPTARSWTRRARATPRTSPARPTSAVQSLLQELVDHASP